MSLEKIKYLVIDEADKMLNMGFIDQVEAILKNLSSSRVTMLFSATMPPKIEALCKKYMNNPQKIEIEAKNITADKIDQVYYETEEKRKFLLLNKVIYTEIPDSCIVFCSTREKVEKLFDRMKSNNYSCYGLHGGMEQKDRLEIMERFKRGEFQFLIATDVAARGIHIDDITHVINYDIPVEKESYVHRIGRTGRAGNKGTAITFVCSYDYTMLNEIEEYACCKIDKREIPSGEEVEKGKKIFEEKLKNRPKRKTDKRSELNKEITKLHINAGKKKKIRPGDIVGTITNIKGVTGDDIGIIDVQDNFSYVDILGNKGEIVLEAFKHMTLKGKKVRVQKAKK